MLRAGCIRVTHPCAGRRQVLLPAMPLDLHVLGPPLAFILSQDQTLHCKKLTGTSTLVWIPKYLCILFAVSENDLTAALQASNIFKELYLL